jgi:hypothetical protein
VVLEDVLAGRRAARFKTSSGFSHGVATTCSLPALTAVVDVLIGCLPDIVRFHREGSSVRLWEISTCISHGRQELLTGHLRDRVLSENSNGRSTRPPADSGPVRRRGVRGVGSPPCRVARAGAG